MKQISLRVILILTTIIILAIVCSAREYTLGETYDQALKASEKIEIAKENVYIARQGRDKALSLLIPRLTAYGSYSRFSEDKYTSVGSILIQPDETSSWGVRADQSFSLSARELDALTIAGQSISKSQYDLQTAQTDFLLNVGVTFYDVLKARKAVDIANANLGRLTQYHHSVETRFKVGELTKTALLRAEGELSGARADQLRAVNSLQLARAALIRVAGLEPDFQLKEKKQPSSGMCEWTSLRQSAMNDRTDLKSYDMQTRMAEQQVQYTRGAFWPSVGLFAIYNRADQDPMTTTFNDENIYGGVSLTFPFFEGGLRTAEYREAKAKERQARLAYDDLKKSVDIELKASCLELETLQGSLQFLQDQQTFARDNYNAVMKQFENGLATSLDVMDANTLLLTADRDLSRASYNYEIAYLRVKQTSGALLQFISESHSAEQQEPGDPSGGDLRARKPGGKLWQFFCLDAL